MNARYRSTLAGLTIALATPALASAQTGSLQVNFNATAAVREHAVMVSVIRNGAIVVQTETVIPASKSFTGLALGTYDVRVEGDGLVTEVKRGVLVTERDRLDLRYIMRTGKGVHIVEYATGGLSREEVAAHLARLDSSVAALQRDVQATKRPD
jgi:hypothetical protein